MKVNWIGVGGNTRRLEDGRSVLSLNVSIQSAASRGSVAITGGAANEFSTYRVTGRYGVANVTFHGAVTDFSTDPDYFRRINETLQGTGVAITAADQGAGTPSFAAIGYGSADFVKVELVDASANGAVVAGTGTAGSLDEAIGSSAIARSSPAQAKVNGEVFQLGGAYGTSINVDNTRYSLQIVTCTHTAWWISPAARSTPSTLI